MKIKVDHKNKLIELTKLNYGDVFYYKDKYYILSKDIASKSQFLRVYSLTENLTMDFGCNVRVSPVQAELIITHD